MIALPRFRPILTLLCLLAPGVASLASATPVSTPVELGADGTIYRLWSGAFSEVFGPANTAWPGAMPVLALDVVHPGQPLLRYLVPGTEGWSTETSAALLFDRSSDSLHVVWSTRTFANLTTSRLNLRSYSATGWSDLIELSGGSLADKSALRIAQTTDEYGTTVDGVDSRVARRILHLAWSENVAGIVRSYYAPVVFINGKYLGWNPVVALDDLAQDEVVSTSEVPEALRTSPTLVTTPAGDVSISFIQSQTHRLVSVALQALPGEIGELADFARGHIVELASSVGTDDRAQLAALARGHIVELAGRFHSSAAGYFGDSTAALLVAADPATDGPTLGEMARGHIVELGREILAAGLQNRCASSEALLEVPPLDPSAQGAGTAFSHFLALRRVASWELPADLVSLGATDLQVLVSANGTRATIAWSDAGHLNYRESDADGVWGPARALDLLQISIGDAWEAIGRHAAGL
ncbi:MAG: hypothetical protein ABI639_01770 [Thermoanaerobaculia bacterium]